MKKKAKTKSKACDVWCCPDWERFEELQMMFVQHANRLRELEDWQERAQKLAKRVFVAAVVGSFIGAAVVGYFM